MKYPGIFFIYFFIAASLSCCAQQNPDSISYVHIRNVIIKGNKTTKDYIILREAQLKANDSIVAALMPGRLEQSRKNIYNTSLFNEVKITAELIDTAITDILIEVKERWYIFPTPQFQPVDRNINEWLKTYHADLQRVNYGIKFVHYNLSGRRDQLRIYLLNGYTRNISFSYSAPYSNTSLTEGFSVGGGFSQNREVDYNISYDNRITSFFPLVKDKSFIGSFVRNNYFLNLGYAIRKGIFNRHTFFAGYNYQKVDDSVARFYNPNYFRDGADSRQFVDLVYTFNHADVNNINYPLTGNTYYFSVLKRGFGFNGGVNMLSLEGGYNKYFDLHRNWYAGIGMQAKIKLPFDQAYINQRGLGFGEAYLRGLEYYIIDGVAYSLARTTLKKKILSFKLPMPFKSKSHPYIPFTFYAKTYGDVGYSYNKKQYDTYLNNRFLYTGGFGIDIFTFYDLNMRFEYSFNQLGEKGLFLHTQSGF
ncbi:MAG: POTRA domain-containing protein [Ferruginibacter sp.]